MGSEMCIRDRDLEFTGDRTKLVAFNRSTRVHDPDEDIDIQDVIATGQGVCGNATHLWVLADGWLRCWTHSGARDAARDIRTPEGAWTACWHNGTDVFISKSDDLFRWNGSSWTRAGSDDFPDQALSGSVDGITFGSWTGVPTTGYALVGTVLTEATYSTQAEAFAVPGGNVANAFAAGQDAERALHAAVRERTRARHALYECLRSGDDPDCRAQETGLLVAEEAIIRAVAAIHEALNALRLAELNPDSASRRDVTRWRSSRTFGLQEFLSATGLFRDGNDIWVIEPDILVAAKFTIQDDGTIVRNLS